MLSASGHSPHSTAPRRQARFCPWRDAVAFAGGGRGGSNLRRAGRVRPVSRAWFFAPRAGKSPCVKRTRRYSWEFHGLAVAGVAQSAEHRFCKPTVVSSTLTASSAGARPTVLEVERERRSARNAETYRSRGRSQKPGGYPSGQRGQTVNLVALPSQVRILLHPFVGPARSLDPTRREQERGRRPAPGRRRTETQQRRGCNSMVEYLPSKQATWVRFPSPALEIGTMVTRIEGPAGENTTRPFSHRSMLPWLSR